MEQHKNVTGAQVSQILKVILLIFSVFEYNSFLRSRLLQEIGHFEQNLNIDQNYLDCECLTKFRASM